MYGLYVCTSVYPSACVSVNPCVCLFGCIIQSNLLCFRGRRGPAYCKSWYSYKHYDEKWTYYTIVFFFKILSNDKNATWLQHYHMSVHRFNDFIRKGITGICNVILMTMHMQLHWLKQTICSRAPNWMKRMHCTEMCVFLVICGKRGGRTRDNTPYATRFVPLWALNSSTSSCMLASSAWPEMFSSCLLTACHGLFQTTIPAAFNNKETLEILQSNWIVIFVYVLHHSGSNHASYIWWAVPTVRL